MEELFLRLVLISGFAACQRVGGRDFLASSVKWLENSRRIFFAVTRCGACSDVFARSSRDREFMCTT